MPLKRLALLLALAACGDDGDAAGFDATPPDAPSAGIDDLAALLEPIRADFGVPALAGAVASGEGLLALGAVGVRRAGDDVPVTSADRFHLGSDTKAMTATLAALAVEEGILTWETRLDEALPDLAATMDPAYVPITLEALLAHRGGFAGNPPPDVWSEMWARVEEPPMTTRAWVVEQVLGRPPEGTAGTFLYSNLGYMVAGAILERRLGASWETLMAQRIFTPLEMASCGFGAPGTAGTVDEPRGHQAGMLGWVPVEPGPEADNPPSLGPAGTVHCSLPDWAKFAAMHLAGARGESSFVSAASFTRLQTPWPGGDYALGWSVVDRSWAGGRALTHAGSNTMWFAVVWIAPARDRLLLAASNADGDPGAQATDAVAGALVGAYLP